MRDWAAEMEYGAICRLGLIFLLIVLLIRLKRPLWLALGGGIALLVLLMSIAWAAMQISPTHVCAFVACNYYGTTLGDLFAKAMPVLVPFCVLVFGYSVLLGLPLAG